MSDGLSRLSRSKSAGRFGRQQQKQPETLTQNFEVDSDLNVRVKERDPTTAGEERPKSRLMSAIFKGVGGGDPNSSVEQKTTEFKETLKRPLSSLFRRTQSQHDRRAAAATLSSQPTSNALSSLPPQQQPLLRLTPTGRSPIVATNSSSQQSQKGTMGSGRTTMTTNQQQGARGSGVANGNSPGTASVSTTAIRPFSGFPGGRPSLNTQRESTYGQMGDGEQQQLAANTLQTDLSEQASIAPQISLRRLSGISYTSEHNFARRDGGGGLQRRNSGKIGGEIDVNFLSRFLCPADETGDERIPWNWDSLFASVSSELREEWALEEEANNGEIPTAAIAGELGTMPNGLNQQQGNGSRNTNSGQWRRN